MDCNVLHSCVFCAPDDEIFILQTAFDGLFMWFVLVSVFNEFPVKDV